jgi:hypothetical protein
MKLDWSPTGSVDHSVRLSGRKCVEGIGEIAKLLICEAVGIEIFRP